MTQTVIEKANGKREKQNTEDSPAQAGSFGYGPGEKPQWEHYSKCVHCGLCLNACPTYRELGVEMDSPRGRIHQMIQVDRGRLPLGESFARHIDLCLDCRSCETACPSGVEYGRLVEAARGQIEKYYHRPAASRFLRWLVFREILPHPRRLETLGSLLRFYQQSGLEGLVEASGLLKLFSSRLGQAAQLSPRMERPFFTTQLGSTFPAEGPRRYRVAFLSGCIASLAFARMNEATLRVLARNGCEVVVPAGQGCCGALNVHAGLRDLGREMALRNIRAFATEEFDAIITNAAGCGSVLKEYPHLFEQQQPEHHAAAQAFSSKVKDITEFLEAIEFNEALGELKARVTYQDPCHLLHGQRLKSAPRRLIARVPGIDFVELTEPEICCGSAGLYNVVHSEMATRLLRSKMKRVDETGADWILTANPGCLLQLRAGVRASSRPERRVLHVVELLDEAYAAYDRAAS